MALDIKIDFANGVLKNELVSGKERILQQIRIAVRIFKGNWELDSNYGNSFLDYGADSAITMTEIREMIFQVEGVIAIKSINVSNEFDSKGKGDFIINAVIQMDSETIRLENERIA